MMAQPPAALGDGGDGSEASVPWEAAPGSERKRNYFKHLRQLLLRSPGSPAPSLPPARPPARSAPAGEGPLPSPAAGPFHGPAAPRPSAGAQRAGSGPARPAPACHGPRGSRRRAGPPAGCSPGVRGRARSAPGRGSWGGWRRAEAQCSASPRGPSALRCAALPCSGAGHGLGQVGQTQQRRRPRAPARWLTRVPKGERGCGQAGPGLPQHHQPSLFASERSARTGGCSAGRRSYTPCSAQIEEN